MSIDLKGLIKKAIDSNLSRESAMTLMYWTLNSDGDSLTSKLELLNHFEVQLKTFECSPEDVAEIYYELMHDNIGHAKAILSKFSKENTRKLRSFTPMTITKPNQTKDVKEEACRKMSLESSNSKYFKEDLRSAHIAQQIEKSKQLEAEEKVRSSSIRTYSNPPPVKVENSIQQYPVLTSPTSQASAFINYSFKDTAGTTSYQNRQVLEESKARDNISYTIPIQPTAYSSTKPCPNPNPSLRNPAESTGYQNLQIEESKAGQNRSYITPGQNTGYSSPKLQTNLRSASSNMIKSEEVPPKSQPDLRIPQFGKPQEEVNPRIDYPYDPYNKQKYDETHSTYQSDRSKLEPPNNYTKGNIKATTNYIGKESLSTRPEDLISKYEPLPSPRTNPIPITTGITPNHARHIGGEHSSISESEDSFRNNPRSTQQHSIKTSHHIQIKTTQPSSISKSKVTASHQISQPSANKPQPNFSTQQHSIKTSHHTSQIKISQDSDSKKQPIRSSPSDQRQRSMIVPRESSDYRTSGRSLNVQNRCYQCGLSNDLVKLGNCDHIACKTCLMKHAAALILRDRFPNQCPIEGCSRELDGTTVLSVLPQNFRDKYEELGLRQVLGKDTGSKMIRCPGCKSAFSIEDRLTHIECPYCKRYYCLNCNSPSHSGKTCAENKAELNKYRSRSSVPISKNPYPDRR